MNLKKIRARVEAADPEESRESILADRAELLKEVEHLSDAVSRDWAGKNELKSELASARVDAEGYRVALLRIKHFDHAAGCYEMEQPAYDCGCNNDNPYIIACRALKKPDKRRRKVARWRAEIEAGAGSQPDFESPFDGGETDWGDVVAEMVARND